MELKCEGWAGTSEFSEDMKYRYVLTRSWPDGEGTVVFIMLNPSTATDKENDPSVRRCIGYARRWGFGTLVIVNLFALRSTDPKELYKAASPIGGVSNDDAIIRQCRYAQKVVCAWGVHGDYKKRGIEVLKLLNDASITLTALQETKAGIPKHPLYLKGDLVPYEMTGVRR
jgi:hypothetical protein